ncbi:hypothetical protein U1Q18_039261 [Sarracenia purpurea var. burkii]
MSSHWRLLQLVKEIRKLNRSASVPNRFLETLNCTSPFKLSVSEGMTPVKLLKAKNLEIEVPRHSISRLPERPSNTEFRVSPGLEGLVAELLWETPLRADLQAPYSPPIVLQRIGNLVLWISSAKHHGTAPERRSVGGRGHCNPLSSSTFPRKE